MNEYKRLTMVNNGRAYMKQCDGHSCYYCINACEDAVERLAELEDKIENRTLVDLPCKVGDTIWYVLYYRTEDDFQEILESWEIKEICIRKDYILYKLTHENTNDYNCANSRLFNEFWFTTKEQAEARLKELKGE